MTNISCDGVLALTQANWTKIAIIDLSNYSYIKAKIKSNRKDVNIYKNLTGIWHKFFYVVKY
jgi:hypothetical protein